MRRAPRSAALVAATTGLLIALSAAPGVFLRADDAAKVTGDLKKMQGTWIAAEDNGPDVRWVVEGDNLKASINGQDFTCKLTLDEKATPATADIAISEGPGDTPGKTSKAIYKFDGEKFAICVALPGADTRPAKFETVEGESFVFAMKKEKEKDDKPKAKDGNP